MSEFLFYFELGMRHVLDWNAYDHMLFLIVLVVAYTFQNWKKIAALVTLFTLGHSISLLLAVYGVVSINARLVEFLIPITILITALFHVFTAGKSAHNNYRLLYASTLFFGLVHGFAFSSGFKIASSGASSKLLALLEFALGIEVAQIIVVVVVLLISFIVQTFFRFSKRDWILVIASVIIGMIIPMIIANKIW